MRTHQMTTPILLQNGQTTRLRRIPFDQRFESEAWLQMLLHENPTLLPLAEIEPAASGCVSIARELPTDAGPLDLLLANSDGFLTLVETKLWRNPDARRGVIAQVIDYAKELARWDYDQLVQAVRKATGEREDPLRDRVRVGSPTFDEQVFIDAVSRNLSRGRFLLLVVGDGIQEGVEHMADFLQQTPQLGFTLGLVQMGLYRIGDVTDGPLLVQPRILARTREVVRAVVEVRAGIDPKDIRVSLPAQQEPSGKSARLTEQLFFEELSTLKDPRVIASARWLLDEAPKHGLFPFWNKESFGLYFKDVESGYQFCVANVDSSGEVPIYLLRDQCRRLGLSDQIWSDYFDEVAALIPEGRRTRYGKDDNYEQVVGTGGAIPKLTALTAKGPQWLAAMDRVSERVRSELKQQQ